MLEIICIIAMSMLSGTLFGLHWALSRASTQQYVSSLQLMLPPLETWFPPLCFANLGALILLVVFGLRSPGLVAAGILSILAVIAVMLITVRGNVPINAHIKSWDLRHLSQESDDLMRRWHRYNNARTIVICVSYIVLVVAVVVRNP